MAKITLHLGSSRNKVVRRFEVYDRFKDEIVYRTDTAQNVAKFLKVAVSDVYRVIRTNKKLKKRYEITVIKYHEIPPLKKVDRIAVDETFYTIENYINEFNNNYMISKYGRVITIDRKGNESIIKGSIYTNKTGLKYRQVALRYKDGSKHWIPLHRLLAYMFKRDSIDNPMDFTIRYSDNKTYVINHLNGDTLDNRLENIRISSQKENIRHALDILEKEFGKAPVKVMGVNIKNPSDYRVYDTTKDACRAHGVQNPGSMNQYLNKHHILKIKDMYGNITEKWMFVYLDEVVKDGIKKVMEAREKYVKG